MPASTEQSARDRSNPRRIWRWIVAVPFAVLLLLLLTIAFLDEPIRRYAEGELNRRVEGYGFTIGKLHLNPLALSLDIRDVTVTQVDHPEPPIAELRRWHASIHWRELLSGHLVSDHVIDHPLLHITRPQAAKEVDNEVPVKEQGWQEAVLAIYPLKINELTVSEGDITYSENRTSQPLHVSQLNLRASNIRNVRSKPNEYPSDIRLDAVVFEKGRVSIDGHADFFAEPSMAFKTVVDMQEIDLTHLLPLTSQRQIHIAQGVLSASGEVEYSPSTQVVHLKDLTLQDPKVDFAHSAATAMKEQDTKQKVEESAKAVDNHPELLLRIDKGHIENGEFGFVNKATKPPYRVFISKTNISLQNWSNRLSEGTALVKLEGLFMGTGETRFDGAFRPETKSPDFSLDLRVWKTQVKTMNNLLRAYGGVDVASGVFSVFTQMTVKDGHIDGYLKPLFKDVKAYDPKQDEDKGFLKKIYEKLINAASVLLKNTERGEVAAKTDLSGPVENPRTNTWEFVMTLFQNAFFEAILPGLEGQTKRS